MIKQTPLFKIHQKYGAQLISFAGWKMPLKFSQAQQEHLNVRKNVGIFDVSHMGKIRIKGERVLDSLSYLLSHRISDRDRKQSQYNLLCNESGGIIDDLIVYCLQKDKDYLLCVNSVNTEKNLKWILKNSKSSLDIQIEEWGLLALQGPKAISLAQEVLGSQVLQIQKFNFDFISYLNQQLIVSRTGYTGEDGFEIFCPYEVIESLWENFFKFQDSFQLTPVGLAARDTLRLEMKYPLYGQDMNEETRPCEMGLTWACKNPANFIGQKFCLQETENKWIGFEIKEPSGIPRQGYGIFKNSKKIGHVTSGVFSPSLKKMIGGALVKKEYSQIGDSFFVQIHNKNTLAQVVSTPFFKKDQG